MNYPKKEARARVWGGESWLLVSMINYKFTMNIAKNKTEDMMALNIQDPWNICKLWGRSLIISWPLVFAHFCYSGWMVNLFGCVIHPVTSPWHSNLIVFSVAMSSSSRYNPPSGKKQNKTKHGFKLFCKAFLWFPVCILQNLRALFLKFNGICCRVKKGSLFSLPLSNKGNVKKKKEKPLSAALTLCLLIV